VHKMKCECALVEEQQVRALMVSPLLSSALQ